MDRSTLTLIVTYNRLSDLKICVEAVRKQTYRGFNILVVNNGSTDGTKEWLARQTDIITINQENLGGAGGFYTGMKYMYDNGYEWLIMMDDDGIPDKDEIKNLIQSYDKVVSSGAKRFKSIPLFIIPAAIHYHPKEKGKKGNIIPFVSKYQILVKPQRMSHYYYRNEGFIYNTYPEKKKHMMAFCVAHMVYNITHFRFVELAKFIKYFRKGMHNEY